ncbi:4a-hydroxytetrahydrobiopterin dehydratase [Antrihabitans stalactiti]|uniref:Putative pterin-4-alpha-carbinolamine dehydratase n=1 Tax=Antrihabitans stalactiti TaxID=2584121 RepID=A0A848KIN9_9NOCA|nr:4a-hydroxytetrahydrobiopterin dehydratase [Antrihabitans stalactiti]NMN97658.1 4a-hydroxytetrahydrobiopterin dehydratase [Antrihabitans stalactiti]
MATLLSDAELADALTELSGWTKVGDTLTQTFARPTFPEAIEFVGRVAVEAEAANHHPDIDIRWRNVTFTLSTHSEGGLTELDLALARTIDRLAS